MKWRKLIDIRYFVGLAMAAVLLGGILDNNKYVYSLGIILLSCCGLAYGYVFWDSYRASVPEEAGLLPFMWNILFIAISSSFAAACVYFLVLLWGHDFQALNAG